METYLLIYLLGAFWLYFLLYLDLHYDLNSYFFMLYELAVMGALKKPVKTTTGILAERLGISQQTASRHLIKLENKGLIRRTSTQKGCLIRISSKGEDNLRKVYSVLNAMFMKEEPSSIVIEGTVFSGLGEGTYYITNKSYREQFIKKLGYEPYPGTLNVRINEEYVARLLEEIDIYPSLEIVGFKDDCRTYGSVRCFPATINNIEKVNIVLALRTHYDKSVIEIISPFLLREKLNLRDGSRIRIEIYPAKKSF